MHLINHRNEIFTIGEIVLFISKLSPEKYLGRLEEYHIKQAHSIMMPHVYKATLEQKKVWYESEAKYLSIE